MSDYLIRQLSSDDLLVMDGLLSLFGDVFDEPSTYNEVRPDRDYTQSLLEDVTFIAIVALDNEMVVGGLAAYELKKFEQARSEIYIYDLAVSPDRRRQGIATALIEKLQKIGGDRGAHVIFVQADYGMKPPSGFTPGSVSAKT